MTYVDVVTFGIAFVGATLGILNFWIERSRTRVRIKVIPKLGYLMGRDSDGSELWIAAIRPDAKYQAEIRTSHRLSRWSIEVINLSEFPVSISHVGFGNPAGDAGGNRYSIVMPILRTWRHVRLIA